MLYFKNISEIGNLYCEKILFEFDKIPMIFVCYNNGKKNRYLCVCTDCIIGNSWMLAKIERTTLIDLIKDKISILKAFEETNDKIYIINKDTAGYSYLKYDFVNIPPDELPDADEKLENPFLKNYLNQLEFEEIFSYGIWKNRSIFKMFLQNPQKVCSEKEMLIISNNKSRVNSGYGKKILLAPEESTVTYLGGRLTQEQVYNVSGTTIVKSMSL